MMFSLRFFQQDQCLSDGNHVSGNGMCGSILQKSLHAHGEAIDLFSFSTKEPESSVIFIQFYTRGSSEWR